MQVADALQLYEQEHYEHMWNTFSADQLLRLDLSPHLRSNLIAHHSSVPRFHGEPVSKYMTCAAYPAEAPDDVAAEQAAIVLVRFDSVDGQLTFELTLKKPTPSSIATESTPSAAAVGSIQMQALVALLRWVTHHSSRVISKLHIDSNALSSAQHYVIAAALRMLPKHRVPAIRLKRGQGVRKPSNLRSARVHTLKLVNISVLSVDRGLAPPLQLLRTSAEHVVVEQVRLQDPACAKRLVDAVLSTKPLPQSIAITPIRACLQPLPPSPAMLHDGASGAATVLAAIDETRAVTLLNELRGIIQQTLGLYTCQMQIAVRRRR